jgi:hypothetical protein
LLRHSYFRFYSNRDERKSDENTQNWDQDPDQTKQIHLSSSAFQLLMLYSQKQTFLIVCGGFQSQEHLKVNWLGLVLPQVARIILRSRSRSKKIYTKSFIILYICDSVSLLCIKEVQSKENKIIVELKYSRIHVICVAKNAIMADEQRTNDSRREKTCWKRQSNALAPLPLAHSCYYKLRLWLLITLVAIAGSCLG